MNRVPALRIVRRGLGWCLPGIVLATRFALAGPVEIHLPPDTSRLRSADLPGYRLAVQKCGICHSADYVNFQPPAMSQAQWTAEMTKMQRSYGAPISDDDVKLIGAYLAVAYGSAHADDPEVTALAALAAPPASATPDVPRLLESHACLSCHAVDHRVVGPALREVAARYRGAAGARADVALHIQQGGSGRWGETAMPAMADLSVEQAAALADFVLGQ